MALTPWAIALSIIAMTVQTERILRRMSADRAALDAAIAAVPGATQALLQPTIASLQSKATPGEDFSAEIAMLQGIPAALQTAIFPPAAGTPSTPTNVTATVTPVDPATAEPTTAGASEAQTATPIGSSTSQSATEAPPAPETTPGG